MAQDPKKPSALERLSSLKRQQPYAGSHGNMKERRASQAALKGKIAEVQKQVPKSAAEARGRVVGKKSAQQSMRDRMKTMRDLAKEP